MINKINWLERNFEFHDPVGVFPCVLARLRGIPARLEDIIRNLPPSILDKRHNGTWSIQENVGHLLDLEELGERRLADYMSHVDVLTPADMTNVKTHGADHHSDSMKELLQKFRTARESLVNKLSDLTEDQVALTALHPRLNKPMRMVDWVFFMAEHDDNHVARIIELGRVLH